MLDNEIPAARSRAATANDRLITLEMERKHLRSQLNGNHGEATNTDDMEREPYYGQDDLTDLQIWSFITDGRYLNEHEVTTYHRLSRLPQFRHLASLGFIVYSPGGCQYTTFDAEERRRLARDAAFPRCAQLFLFKCVDVPLTFAYFNLWRPVERAVHRNPKIFLNHISAGCFFSGLGISLYAHYERWGYVSTIFANFVGVVLVWFVVVSQLNGTHGEATNTDDLASVVISSQGKHKYEIDNSASHRREEVIHASPKNIRRVISAKPKIRANTKKLKASAEKLEKKAQVSARDVDRCEKAFSRLLHSLDPDVNYPQFGFNMGELLTKWGLNPKPYIDTCQRLASQLASASASFESLSQKAEAAWPWIKAILKTTTLVTTTAVLVWSIRTNRKIIALVSAGLLSTYILATGISDAFLKALIDSVPIHLAQAPKGGDPRPYVEDPSPLEPEFQEPSTNEPQGGSVLSLDQKSISQVLVSAFSAGFVCLADTRKGVFSALKDYVVHFPAVVKGIDTIVEFCSKFVLDALNAVRKSQGLETYESLLDNQSPFINWICEVEHYLHCVDKGEIAPSSGVYGQVNAFIEAGHEHSRFLRTVTSDSNAHTRLAATMHKLALARDQLTSFNGNIVADRPKPVCIVLYGRSGKGKSHFAEMLADAWLAKVLDPEAFKLYRKNRRGYIYCRTPETEYWDGYAGQIICMVDDFMQKKEVAGGDSVALDIIRCVNGFPALLHMAALGDKTKTYFRSELVICSTNVEIPWSDAIVCNDAVLRRPDIYINLDFQDELLKVSPYLDASGVDMGILNAINSIPDWDKRASVYKILPYRITKNRQAELAKEPITARQLLQFMLDQRSTNIDTFKHVLPPASADRMAEANRLIDIFMARANKPQSPGDVSSRLTPEAYKRFCEVMDSYIKALEALGPSDPATQAFREILDKICEENSVPWLAVEREFWPSIKIAEAAWNIKESMVPQEWKHVREPISNVISPNVTPPGSRTASISSVLLKPEVSNETYFRKLFTRTSDYIQNTLGPALWEFFKTYWRWIVITAGAIAGGIAVYGLVRAWADLENDPQSVNLKHNPRSVKRSNFREMLQRQKPQPQSNEPQGNDAQREQLESLLAHCYHISLAEKDPTVIGHVQLLDDRIGVTNSHTCELIAHHVEMHKISAVWLRKFGKPLEIKSVPVEYFTRVNRDERTPGLDIVLVLLNDCQLGSSKNFIKHIPTEADWEGKTQIPIMMRHLSATNEKPIYSTDAKAVVNKPTGDYTFKAANGKVGLHYTNEWTIAYFVETQRGQCGLPIVAGLLGNSNYLAGIHKSYNGAYAAAAPLVREWVQQEIALLLSQHSPVLLTHDDDTTFNKPQNNFPQCYPAEVVGIVPAFHGSSDTKLQCLPHAHMFKLDTGPAVLDTVVIDGHVVNPYIKNREKIPLVQPHFPKVPHLNALVSGIINNPTMPDASDMQFWRRRMTYDEAVEGIPGTVFSGLDLTTSVGYPKVLTGLTTKRAWFTDKSRSEAVKAEVLEKIDMLKQGKRPLFLHMDVLKDERRPMDKVKTASTRVVVVGPLDLLIINRMFFGGFASWTQINKITNGVTIGMNPYSAEFGAMVAQLFVANFKQFAGDREKFDLCQHQELLRAIFNAINEWYGPDDPDNIVRKLLAIEFMFPRHVTFPVHATAEMLAKCQQEPVPEDVWVVSSFLKIINAVNNKRFGFVYIVSSGHPSGSYLTALINSWYSVCEPVVVLQFHIRDLQQVLEMFQKGLVRSATLGDDFVTSVHPIIQNTLNAVTFAQFSGMYGMRVTREDKSAITDPFSDPNDIVFLKRLFRFEPAVGRYVGALHIPAIIDMMCWMRKSRGRPPSDAEILQLFNTALLEFSLWGRKTFLEYKPKVVEAAVYTLGKAFSSPFTDWSYAVNHVSEMPIPNSD
jgi:hypothetical protein